MATRHEGSVLNTYRYLRVAMVLLVLLLTAAVALQVFGPAPDCWQRSVSAYYYTPARAVFVASLCAIGACLVIYRGNTDAEDIALNASGLLAFVVAFVPTQVDDACPASNAPSPAELDAAVTNNVWALYAAGVALTAVAWFLRNLTAPDERGGSLSLWPLVFSGVAVVVFPFVFVNWHDAVRDHGHDVAAIALFAGIVVVVGMNALGLAAHSDGGRPLARRAANRYTVVGLAMVATFVGVLVVHWAVPGFLQWLFWLEALLLAEFAVYWVLQTVELWNVVERAEAPEPSPGLTTPAPPPVLLVASRGA
ncbi:hypothetical protein [Knoellia sp. p5-6-4]|uniref:hypothetical protein n=1 Tax=unclassified Knoellia TaxID=2618719 RepID=UPI0023DB0B42|nr:hypothetical protein [Knoellia sp. p5-6-4]MDF2145343.1 hypothetical protein [Knoellia sp. p5-6-4]